MREVNKYQITEKENKGKTPSADSIIKKIKSYKEGAVREFKESRLLVKIIMSAAKEFLKNKYCQKALPAFCRVTTVHSPDHVR
jgi:hypothetical protein